MDLTISKLLDVMAILPKADGIPAKFRAHPTTIPWLKQALARNGVVYVGPPSVITSPLNHNETLLGMPITEDDEMPHNLVEVVSASGSVMKTIVLRR